jgi:hypothetical protein
MLKTILVTVKQLLKLKRKLHWKGANLCMQFLFSQFCVSFFPLTEIMIWDVSFGLN